MNEVKDVYHPLLMLVKDGKIQGKAADYVDSKFRLLLKLVIPSVNYFHFYFLFTHLYRQDMLWHTVVFPSIFPSMCLHFKQ